MWAQVLLRVHYEMDDRPIGKSPTLPSPSASAGLSPLVTRRPAEVELQLASQARPGRGGRAKK
eukprot:COSAG01_NODE_56978_length_315_cov_0.717593_1_plen_62_part_10